MIPNVSHDLVKGFLEWINSADDDEDEREARAQSVETLLYEGADDAEVARIDKIVRDVAAGREPKQPELEPPPVEEQPAKKWSSVKLYDPARTGYMRATREEGVGAELKAARKESMGSPLYGHAETRAGDGLASILRRRETSERLKQLLRPSKKS